MSAFPRKDASRGRAAIRLLAGLLLAVLLPGAAPAASPDATPEASPRGVRQPAPAARDTASLRIPDVPFVAQTEALCGGAAVSMALRYWGERGVGAGDFRHLVSGRPAGIRTDDLLEEVRERGWRARRVDGSPEAVAGHLEEGRPVIALIRVAPGRFHYVVVLALTADRALYHDPADGPYRVMERGEWDEAREAADRWAALALDGEAGQGGEGAGAGAGDEGDGESAADEPEGGGAADGAPGAAGPGSGGASAGDPGGLPEPCRSLVRTGVRGARGGEPGAEGERRETGGSAQGGAAEEALRAAAELCPGRPEPWAELAGLRFRQESYGEAARLARRAADRSGGGDDGEYAWRLRGTALYLSGDRDAALRAWNRIGVPEVDHVRIQGLGRTRHRPALDLLGLEPGTTLTADGLLRGRRRLAEMPALRRSRVDYRAVEGGRTEVRAAVWERSPPTASLPRAAAVAARALAARDLRLSWPAPTGGGELVSASWRWTPGRPALSLGARAPGPGGALAAWGAEGVWERQSYHPEGGPQGPQGATGAPAAGPEPGETLEEERRSAVVSAADWLTGRLRGRAAVGYDRWIGGRRGEGDHRYLRAGLGARWRTDGGGWAARLRGAAWAPLAEGRPSFRTLAADARGRLGEAGSGVTASFRGGLRRASAGAPLSLWPGAGTGRGRPQLLRAHPLLEDGRVTGPAFGRSLVHGGAETTAWLGGIGPVRAGVAGFVDAAAVADRAEGWPGERAHVDAGTGLRLGIGPGGGTLRLDGAVGLRDGRTALSVGWISSGGALSRP